uniref:Serine aminopeptidase S33 domain-containing protein n=1 Tax=Acidobacterium capsulatum TaxID=33075 RepID=A0A7V5CTL7_9BACT
MAKKKSSKRPGTVYYAPGSPMAPRGSQTPLATLRWVLVMASFAVVLALLGAYAVLCTMFWQNQWEMIFAVPGSAAAKVTATPSSVGVPFETVGFRATEPGETALTGWWIPAANNARYAHDTVLYLHGAKASMSGSLPELKTLHQIGVNVLIFDYHGFGASGGPHATEQQADADALAAWNYLVQTRRVPEARIVAFGSGAGASFAAHLAATHPVGALILADISPTAHEIFEQDARARLLPMVLLQREQLDPRPALKTLRTPKLFLAWKAGSDAQTRADFEAARVPKRFADLRRSPESERDAVLRSFLDETVR